MSKREKSKKCWLSKTFYKNPQKTTQNHNGDLNTIVKNSGSRFNTFSVLKCGQH